MKMFLSEGVCLLLTEHVARKSTTWLVQFGAVVLVCATAAVVHPIVQLCAAKQSVELLRVGGLGSSVVKRLPSICKALVCSPAPPLPKEEDPSVISLC
jgi:hypothetical protein